MISAETLAAAVELGVIAPDQARRIMALERDRANAGAEPDHEEKLRLVSGFGDIFVVLGLALFLSAAAYFIGLLGLASVMFAGLAAMSWALAEFFTRVRRMALPSIALLVTFVVSCFAATFYVMAPNSSIFRHIINGETDVARALAYAAAGALTAAMTALHYRRFRVPITIAAGVAALACTALALLYATAPMFTAAWRDAIVLALGLAVFALAMRFDMSDPERVTRRTDIAFWLHLLAAPMIVHPLVSGMFTATGSAAAPNAVAILAIFFALGAIAVLVDRRALLVSGLSYAGLAFGALLRQSGLADSVAPTTMLTLGAFVLLLSAGWRPLRTTILNILPGALSSRLPPPSKSLNA
ncbi:MAG: hypothetical protein ACT4OU_13015 [Hyphomicrobium sp.]